MSPNARCLFISMALVLSVSGCSTDDSGASPTDDVTHADASDETDVSAEDDAVVEDDSAEEQTEPDAFEEPAPSCPRSGFNVAFDYASTEAYGLQYVALSGLEAPLDVMLVQRFDDFGGPTEPGTYSLEGVNYADCGLCLLAQTSCASGSCDKIFYAEQGTVTISAIGGLGDQFTATLEGVVFDEVTINPQTYVSTPVVGGETWCVDGYTFDETIRTPDEAACSRPDIACVGEAVADFELLSCATGSTVSLSSLAEGNKAVWLVAVAGWCSACAEWVPQVQAYYNERHDDGLAVVFVMGENGDYGQPSTSYCRNWATLHDSDYSLYYVDHDGVFGYANLFGNVWNYPEDDGSFLLPWNAVLDASTKKLEYADGAGGDLENTLDDLLGQ